MNRRMRTAWALLVLAACLASLPASAAPSARLEYRGGTPTIVLDGDWSGSRYTVLRASSPGGTFAPITYSGVLCTGACFADDTAAEPGARYWYRFDLELPDGSFASHGPFEVLIPPVRLSAAVWPNPVRERATIDLNLYGPASEPAQGATVTLHDLQGRAVAHLFRGTLGRGRTTIAWDAAGTGGARLGTGVYFLRFATAAGTHVSRVVLAR